MEKPDRWSGRGYVTTARSRVPPASAASLVAPTAARQLASPSASDHHHKARDEPPKHYAGTAGSNLGENSALDSMRATSLGAGALSDRTMGPIMMSQLGLVYLSRLTAIWLVALVACLVAGIALGLAYPHLPPIRRLGYYVAAGAFLSGLLFGMRGVLLPAIAIAAFGLMALIHAGVGGDQTAEIRAVFWFALPIMYGAVAVLGALVRTGIRFLHQGGPQAPPGKRETPV